MSQRLSAASQWPENETNSCKSKVLEQQKKRQHLQLHQSHPRMFSSLFFTGLAAVNDDKSPFLILALKL